MSYISFSMCLYKLRHYKTIVLANYALNKLNLTYYLKKKWYKIWASLFIGVHKNNFKLQRELLKVQNVSKQK